MSETKPAKRVPQLMAQHLYMENLDGYGVLAKLRGAGLAALTAEDSTIRFKPGKDLQNIGDKPQA